MEADGKLFADLYIYMQTREGDMAEFFKHENSTQNGKIRKTSKADLLRCLFHDDETLQLLPDVVSEILDGPTIVKMLLLKAGKDINQYANEIFCHF